MRAAIREAGAGALTAVGINFYRSRGPGGSKKSLSSGKKSLTVGERSAGRSRQRLARLAAVGERAAAAASTAISTKRFAGRLRLPDAPERPSEVGGHLQKREPLFIRPVADPGDTQLTEGSSRNGQLLCHEVWGLKLQHLGKVVRGCVPNRQGGAATAERQHQPALRARQIAAV